MAMREVPLSRSFISDEIKLAVMRVLESGRFVLDRECEEFEAELAAYTGVRHAVLSSSGTAASSLLYLALGLKPGDEVIMPSHTAFPCVEPIIQLGAKPIFVDIDDTYCIDPDQLESAVTPRTVGILLVHLYGHPGDIDVALAIARRHRLWLIEDCAQALGARYRGKLVGSFGSAAVVSFFPSKNLTVLGDGGCVLTDDDGMAERIRMLRNHGRREKYVHELVGYNLRFNEIQAAIGRVALKHLERHNRRRREIAAYYDDRLAGVVGTPVARPWVEHVYHMYVIRTPRRDALAAFLRKHGVGVGIHYPTPIHLQPALKMKFADRFDLPRTTAAANEILSIPIFGEMSLDDAAYVSDLVVEFVNRAWNL
jgi:dTDP-4-amino-4,6-dideoxygalactose transaminase